jgi:hypothetical protein
VEPPHPALPTARLTSENVVHRVWTKNSPPPDPAEGAR